MFKMLSILAGAAALALSLSAPGKAANFDLIVEGGGTAQIFQLNNGNLLGLWGFDTRPGGVSGGTFTPVDLISSFSAGSQGSIAGFYFGSDAALNAANGGASEFDQILTSVIVADGTRFFDSLWVEWTGGNLVHLKGSSGTSSTMGTTVTLQGDPLAAVPLPAPLALLLSGLIGLGVASWRRKSA